MINIIISVTGILKISDILYIRVCMFNKFIITSDRYSRYQISGVMHVIYPSLLNLTKWCMFGDRTYIFCFDMTVAP